MPETNSSSSHTLTIYGENMLRREEILKIPGLISPDGKTITIPGGNDEDFGRYSQDFNDVVSKLQYVTASLSYYPERKVIIEKVLKDYLGVENVVYDWYDDAAVESWCDQNPNKDLRDCPLIYREDGSELPMENIVDHESMYLVDDHICESEETLRDFLFSPNSWIFAGECDVTEPGDKFPSLRENEGGVFFTLDPREKNADPGGKIGKIEFEVLSNFPYSEVIPKLLPPTPQNQRGWGIEAKRRPWIQINTDEGFEWIRDKGEWEKLTSLWLKRNITTGEMEMMWGDIPKEDVDLKIYVPNLTPDTFKYPFQLRFVDINTFGEYFNSGKVKNIANVPNEVVFNLEFSSPNLKIDEYV